jgi:molybdenum cofactor biosynthesis enzyme MoaA
MSSTSVFLFLTRSCDLACRHCYVSASPRLEGYMTVDAFRQTVDTFSNQGVSDFRLTGGEPTIHPEFESFLDFIGSKGLAPRLITNGIRLMQMRFPESVLARTSRCWISVYGLCSKQHRAIGGCRSRPLEEVLEFVGTQNKTGYWVGVSALLTEVSLDSLKAFVSMATKYGVRYLRFLFGEPSGRALSSHAIFAHGDDVRERAREIFDYLRSAVPANAFDFLSLNDPFDLGSTAESAHASCMLATRRMWSVSPEGHIYSCCFNIYDSAHLVRGGMSSVTMSNSDALNIYAPRCKALNADWWGTSGSTTCPISAMVLSRYR